MHTVIAALVDDGEFLEVQPIMRQLVVGFARLAGHPVGIVANQPGYLAGVLDIDASDKGRALHPLLRRLPHSRW